MKNKNETNEKFYTVRQFLTILLKHNKVSEKALSKGNVVKLSKLTKKYCEENNIKFIKTSSRAIRANRGKSVSAYPLAALKETYLSYLKQDEK